MAQQIINIGAVANDGTGDTIRDGGDKINDNFTELYGGLVGLFDPKGSTDCSANPNYPVASKGDVYLVSVAGKIGGASGKVVSVGDLFIAFADNAGGTEASVGTSWSVVQGNVAYDPVNKAGDTMTGDLAVPAETYGVGWNGSNEVPTKNDVYDKIETVAAGSGSTTLAGLTDVDTSGVADGDALTYDSGSSTWVPGAGGGGGSTGERTLVPPVASDYTLQNVGTSSISTVSNGLLLSAPGAVSADIKFVRHTAGPASLTSFSLIMRSRPVVINSGGAYPCSIIVRNATSGKIIIFTNAYLTGTQYLVQRWSAYGTFSANAISPTAYSGWALFPWMQLAVSGGTITFYLSPDGVNWTSIGTETVATYIASIDEVGVGAWISGSSVRSDTIFQSIEIA